MPCSTEFGPERREANMDNVIEVTIKIMADQVVALERAVAAPRGPKAVWLPIPPNAAAMSPLLPLCNSTTIIRKKQTMMWTMVISVIMMFDYSLAAGFLQIWKANPWCGRGDLNPHAFRRHPLKMVCLPVPPLPQDLS